MHSPSQKTWRLLQTRLHFCKDSTTRFVPTSHALLESQASRSIQKASPALLHVDRHVCDK